MENRENTVEKRTQKDYTMAFKLYWSKIKFGKKLLKQNYPLQMALI